MTEIQTFNIAENIFSMMCSLMKNLHVRMEYIQNNGMDWFNDADMCQTYNMSVGFCGFDDASRKVLEICKVFDMQEFYAYAPEVDELPEGVKRVESLGELFENSKIISVHLPLNKNTEKCIKAEHFTRLRKGGMYINLYDSNLHDEDALMTELESGRIRAGILGWHKERTDSGKWTNLVMIGDGLR